MSTHSISNVHFRWLLATVFGFLFSTTSFSQDTIKLFKEKKRVKKDAVEEIQAMPDNTKGRIKWIKYGTSAGSCTGYCSREATIDSVNTVKANTTLTVDPKFPAKIDSAGTSEAHWNMLVSSVQINSFFEIPKKVGNPGANGSVFEWIEINYSGRKHKVAFDKTGPEEYEGIKNLSKLLKQVAGF